jgi:hypothetical protein
MGDFRMTHGIGEVTCGVTLGIFGRLFTGLVDE